MRAVFGRSLTGGSETRFLNRFNRLSVVVVVDGSVTVRSLVTSDVLASSELSTVAVSLGTLDRTASSSDCDTAASVVVVVEVVVRPRCRIAGKGLGAAIL